MGLEQRLNLRLQQRLVMTPTLQQAIKLLQLSRLELEQAMSQEVEVNPLLELTDEAQRDGDDQAEDGEAPVSDTEGGESLSAAEGAESGEERQPEVLGSPGDAASDDGPATGEPAAFSEVELDSLFANYLHDAQSVASTWDTDEDGGPLANTPGSEAGLFENLCRQLGLRNVDGEATGIAEFVIGNLDLDGYLRVPIADLATQLGVAVHKIEAALAMVQSFDPAGLGARDLRECFLLQIERQITDGADDDWILARRIVAQAFDALLHQNWNRVEAACAVNREELLRVVDILRHLNPHPGALIGPIDNPAVEPDLVVRKEGGVWRVTLNEEGLPRLRVSSRYVAMLQNRNTDTEARGYLRERMRSALWFLRSVEQRHSTITRVGQAIVRRQDEFLEHGVERLKPLVLRDIADDIGMHESTVSRVVANKYIHTPRGVFPLKYFFHSAISHAVDGDISSVVVRERIKALITLEDIGKPLSDARIARQLNRVGIRIARRTVAKYREELHIPSSEQRRKALR